MTSLKAEYQYCRYAFAQSEHLPRMSDVNDSVHLHEGVIVPRIVKVMGL